MPRLTPDELAYLIDDDLLPPTRSDLSLANPGRDRSERGRMFPSARGPGATSATLQMRPLPRLRGADGLWRPAPQSLPPVPDVPPRRSAAAGRSLEPLPGADASDWSCVPA